MDDEDFLQERVKDMIEEQLDSEWAQDVKERRQEDEKEQRAKTKMPGPWSREEVEFLANNRRNMDNDELEEFLRGESEIQKKEWSPFSRSEERFILQNHTSSSPDEIAESLDRSVKAVEMQMRLMGLNQ